MTPKWAIELVERVFHDCNRKVPIIKWRRGQTGWGVSGHAYLERNMISITQRLTPWTHEGPWTDVDQELVAVLLHECAHILSPKKTNHSSYFWRLAWKLHEQYGNPLMAARVEFPYRKKAEKYAPPAIVAAYSLQRCLVVHIGHGRCGLSVEHPNHPDHTGHVSGNRWWKNE